MGVGSAGGGPRSAIGTGGFAAPKGGRSGTTAGTGFGTIAPAMRLSFTLGAETTSSLASAAADPEGSGRAGRTATCVSTTRLAAAPFAAFADFGAGRSDLPDLPDLPDLRPLAFVTFAAAFFGRRATFFLVRETAMAMDGWIDRPEATVARPALSTETA